ncbi:hypothetical protein [Flagellimonas sp.]|uniref:hypothetical protein n=1 Tax=Flagellimonas sp. TaxID=2058762 RepID=UPI0034BE03A1
MSFLNKNDFNKSTSLLAAILTIVSVIYGMLTDLNLLIIGLTIGLVYFIIYCIIYFLNKLNDPYKFTITASELCIDLLDETGSNAKITKTHTIKAKKDNLSKITDIFHADGTIDTENFLVSPGTGKISKKAGAYILETSLNRPYHRNEVVDRTIELNFIDTFTKRNEWWDVSPLHPIEAQKIKIKFPRNRPCQSYEIQKIEGTYAAPYKLNSDLYPGEDKRSILVVDFPPILDMNKKNEYRISWIW